MIVFGTVDFGRANYVNVELRNAAREGTRYGKVNPTDPAGIRSPVIDHAVGTGLTSAWRRKKPTPGLEKIGTG